MFIEPYDKRDWLQLVENKSGVKTLAIVPQGSVASEIGYFKYPRNEKVGPIVANEFIAYKIGEELKFPVSKIFFKEFAGLKGAISIKAPGGPSMWRHFPHKKDLNNTLEDYEFAFGIEPENCAVEERLQDIRQRVKAHQPTIPSTIAQERLTNPFLRADEAELAAALNMAGSGGS